MKKTLLLLFIAFTTLSSCNGQNNTEKITIVDIKTMQEKVLDKNIQLIDVRTPLEYQKGFIGDAINANIYTSDFSKAVTKLDKTKPIYLYCHKGGRSNSAAKKLVELGFTEVYDFKGGWKAWRTHQKTK